MLTNIPEILIDSVQNSLLCDRQILIDQKSLKEVIGEFLSIELERRPTDTRAAAGVSNVTLSSPEFSAKLKIWVCGEGCSLILQWQFLLSKGIQETISGTRRSLLARFASLTDLSTWFNEIGGYAFRMRQGLGLLGFGEVPLSQCEDCLKSRRKPISASDYRLASKELTDRLMSTPIRDLSIDTSSISVRSFLLSPSASKAETKIDDVVVSTGSKPVLTSRRFSDDVIMVMDNIRDMGCRDVTEDMIQDAMYHPSCQGDVDRTIEFLMSNHGIEALLIKKTLLETHRISLSLEEAIRAVNRAMGRISGAGRSATRELIVSEAVDSHLRDTGKSVGRKPDTARSTFSPELITTAIDVLGRDSSHTAAEDYLKTPAGRQICETIIHVRGMGIAVNVADVVNFYRRSPTGTQDQAVEFVLQASFDDHHHEEPDPVVRPVVPTTRSGKCWVDTFVTSDRIHQLIATCRGMGITLSAAMAAESLRSMRGRGDIEKTINWLLNEEGFEILRKNGVTEMTKLEEVWSDARKFLDDDVGPVVLNDVDPLMPDAFPLARSTSSDDVSLVHSITNKPEYECVVALEASGGDVGLAVAILEGDVSKLSSAPTIRAGVLARDTSRTILEATCALDYCNDDDEQARLLLEEAPNELGALNRLNEMQRNAVRHVARQSKAVSDGAMERLREKYIASGLSVEALMTTLRYLRDRAPIVIHFPSAVLQFLAKDTHYRNQFETNTSRGCLSHDSRVNWEDRLFNRLYHDAEGVDRVKYGCFNIVSDPEGVKPCVCYGDCFMVLRNVRLRTTFADKDSSCEDTRLATCQYFAHVLETFNENELLAVTHVACGITPNGADSSVISVYKEVQVHGPIKLDHDVESIFVPIGVLESQKDALAQLARKHISIIPMERGVEDTSAIRHSGGSY